MKERVQFRFPIVSFSFESLVVFSFCDRLFVVPVFRFPLLDASHSLCGTHIHTVVFALSVCFPLVSIVSAPSSIDLVIFDSQIPYKNPTRRWGGMCSIVKYRFSKMFIFVAHAAQNYICVSIDDDDKLSGIT